MNAEQRERTLTAARRITTTPLEQLETMLLELTGIDISGLEFADGLVYLLGFSAGIMQQLLEIINGQ